MRDGSVATHKFLQSARVITTPVCQHHTIARLRSTKRTIMTLKTEIEAVGQCNPSVHNNARSEALVIVGFPLRIEASVLSFAHY